MDNTQRHDRKYRILHRAIKRASREIPREKMEKFAKEQGVNPPAVGSKEYHKLGQQLVREWKEWN